MTRNSVSPAPNASAGAAASPASSPPSNPDLPDALARIYTEHEAAHIGAGTVDRSQHEVYRQIRSRSRPGSIGFGQLYSIEETPIDSTLVQRADVPRLVRELEQRRLIAQLPCFEFRADSGWLDLRVYWVARLEHAGLAENNIALIYEELCVLSAKAAAEWLGAMQSSGDIAAGLLRDLEHNLQPGSAAGEGYTPGEMRDWRSDGEFAVFLDPGRVIKNTRLDYRPDAGVLRAFAERVRRELIQNRTGIDMGAPGFLPHHSQSVVAYFETARDFLDARVIPEYLGDRALRRKLDQIALQEALHDIDSDRPATTRFVKARAACLQSHGFRGAVDAPGGLAPGQLAAEVVLRLSSLAEQQYQEQWKDRCQFFVDEFLRGLRMHGGDHKRMLRFVKPKELLEQTPEMWQRLARNQDLICAAYESPRGTEQVFAQRDTLVFRHLVVALRDVPRNERWRIAGFRALMQAPENSDFAKRLNSDPEFQESFDALMRILYGQYVPGFLRWLYWLRLAPIARYLDRAAGRLLSDEERRYQAANRNRIQRLRAGEREAKRERILNDRGGAITAEIVAELEAHYFERMRIPSVNEVTKVLQGVDRETLMALFRKAGFSVLKLIRSPRHAKAGPGEDSAGADPFAEAILLFPQDRSYPGRAHRKLELCRGILASDRDAGKSARDGKRIPFAPDRVQVDRARRLHAFLVRQRSAAPATRS